jgi:hypothetical protein
MKPYVYRQKQRDKFNILQFPLFNGDLLSDLEFHGCWKIDEVVQLQMGMLETALIEVKDKRKSQAMRKQAWDWLMSDEDGPFSARECSVSNALDIDELRQLLRRLVKDI